MPLATLFRALLSARGDLHQAARESGVDYKVLLQTLQRLGVPTPGRARLGPEARAGYLESLVRRGTELGLPEPEMRGQIAPPSGPFPRDRLLEALVEARGNLTQAAVRLGVTFQTVARWMKAMGIPTYQAPPPRCRSGTRQTTYLNMLQQMLRAESGARTGTRKGIEMLLYAPRRGRVIARILAHAASDRLPRGPAAVAPSPS